MGFLLKIPFLWTRKSNSQIPTFPPQGRLFAVTFVKALWYVNAPAISSRKRESGGRRAHHTTRVHCTRNLTPLTGGITVPKVALRLGDDGHPHGVCLSEGYSLYLVARMRVNVV